MQLSIILGRDGAKTRVSGMLFKEVVQAVLLFGSEMWVMTPHTGGAIGGFQHRVGMDNAPPLPSAPRGKSRNIVG